jgi:hypothetical protein
MVVELISSILAWWIWSRRTALTCRFVSLPNSPLSFLFLWLASPYSRDLNSSSHELFRGRALSHGQQTCVRSSDFMVVTEALTWSTPPPLMVALDPAVWFAVWTHHHDHQCSRLLWIGALRCLRAAPPPPTPTTPSARRSADDSGSIEIQQQERGIAVWTEGVPVPAELMWCTVSGYSSGHATGIQREQR